MDEPRFFAILMIFYHYFLHMFNVLVCWRGQESSRRKHVFNEPSAIFKGFVQHSQCFCKWTHKCLANLFVPYLLSWFGVFPDLSAWKIHQFWLNVKSKTHQIVLVNQCIHEICSCITFLGPENKIAVPWNPFSVDQGCKTKFNEVKTFPESAQNRYFDDWETSGIYWTYFSSPVTIDSKIPFRLCLTSSFWIILNDSSNNSEFSYMFGLPLCSFSDVKSTDPKRMTPLTIITAP